VPRIAAGATRAGTLVERWCGAIDDHVIDLAWAPDSHALAAASVSGPIRLFAAGDGSVRTDLVGHGLGTCSMAFSPDGRTLASGGQDGCVRLWPVTGPERAVELGTGTDWVARVGWAPSGQYLAAAAGKQLRLWDPQGGQIDAFTPMASTIADIGWRPSGSEILAAGYGGLAAFRHSETEPVRRYQWKGSVLALAWSPDANWIATGNQDSSVHLWQSQSGKDLHMSGYALKVRELAWSPDSRWLATGGAREVVVWDCSGTGPAGSDPLMLALHEVPITQLAWQRRGRVLASGCGGGLVAAWRPGKHRSPIAIARVPGGVARLAWSADDRLLAVGADDGSIRLFAAPG